MYIRQNRVKNRLGRFEGELGQLPNSTINISDPVDGSQLSFTGPAHEIAPVQALVGLVSGAVGAAKSNKISEAKQVIASAKNLLPATGTQRDKAAFLVNKAERFISEKEAASRGTSAGEVLTGVGSILQALAPAGMTALQTHQEAQLAKAALKAQGSAPVTQYIPVPASGGSNTGVILAVVGGVAVLGLILVMSQKKQ